MYKPSKYVERSQAFVMKPRLLDQFHRTCSYSFCEYLLGFTFLQGQELYLLYKTYCIRLTSRTCEYAERSLEWIQRTRSLDLFVGLFLIHFAFSPAIIYCIRTTDNGFSSDNQARPVVRDLTLHLRSPDLLAVHSLFYFCEQDTTKNHKSHNKSGVNFNIIILK